MRRDLREQEKRQEKRGDLLDQKLDLINKKERDFDVAQRQIGEQQDELRRQTAQVHQALRDQLEALHRIARLTPDEARDLLLKRVEEDLRGEVGGMILKHQAAIRDSASKKPARS